jgi:CPA1 family monovalent cation:H+ antiporter
VASLDGIVSPEADAVRLEFSAHRNMGNSASNADTERRSSHEALHRRALEAARRAALDMRARDEIGDDAFHRLEEELDWVEMGIGPSA